MAIHGKQLRAGTISKDRLNPADIMTEAEYTNTGGSGVLNLTDPAHESKLLEAKAIHEYVQDQVALSGYDLNVQVGTDTDAITDTDTLTFAGTANEIDVALDTATSTITIGLPDDVTIGQNLTVTGDLTVNGTTTTVNSTTVTVDDKNLELGSVANPTDAIADGGGITLKGATDKTFNWVDATDSWTSSEHMDLASGKQYKINNIPILTADNLNGLNAATVDVSADSIAIIDDDDFNNSKKESIVNLVAAMAGTGITANNGVLSATGSSFKIVSITPSNSLASGNLIIENLQTSAYTLPSSPSGEVQLSLNGVIQELGGATGQSDYYVNSSNQIEWNSSVSLDNLDTLIFTYIPA